MVKSAQAVTVEFTTANPATGAAVNADTLPVGTLFVNGVSDAATVTVTNITTGVYKAAVTLPSLSPGDIVGMRIAAVVSAIAGQGIVWEDVADTSRTSEVLAEAVLVHAHAAGAETQATNANAHAHNIDSHVAASGTIATADDVGAVDVTTQVAAIDATVNPAPVDPVAALDAMAVLGICAAVNPTAESGPVSYDSNGRVFSTGSVLTVPVTDSSVPCLKTTSGTIATCVWPAWASTDATLHTVVKVANGSNYFWLLWSAGKYWQLAAHDATHDPVAGNVNETAAFSAGEPTTLIGGWDADELRLSINGRECAIGANTNTAALGTAINIALSDSPQTMGPLLLSAYTKSDEWHAALAADDDVWSDPLRLFNEYATDPGDRVFTFTEDGVAYRRLGSVPFTKTVTPVISPTLMQPGDIARHMVLVDDVYYLYTEQLVTGVWKIYVRTSDDGRHWSDKSASLFASGAAGTWNERGNADPSVMYVGPGDWRMWVDGMDGSDAFKHIGYATSTDGLSWTMVGSVLDCGASGAWDDNALHQPCVVEDDGTLYMLYAGIKLGEFGVYDVGLATSTNGTTWVKSADNPVIPRSTDPADQDYDLVRPSHPVKIGGLWYSFYWGWNDAAHQHTVMVATSPDLLEWTKRGALWIPEGRMKYAGVGDDIGPQVAIPVDVVNGVAHLLVSSLEADAGQHLHAVLVPAESLPGYVDVTQLDATLAAIAALPDTTDVAALSILSAAIKAKTDTIGAAAITVTSPVAESGTVTIYSGDDYAAADGRSITFTVPVANVPSLTGATVKLKTAQVTWTAGAPSSDGTDWTIAFTPTKTQTAALSISRQSYELEATLVTSARVVTIAEGTLVTKKDVPVVP